MTSPCCQNQDNARRGNWGEVMISKCQPAQGTHQKDSLSGGKEPMLEDIIMDSHHQ